MDSEHVNKPLRVFLWMVPRTNSVAFLKCLSFVDDTEVWLEPYLSCLMNETINNPNWGKGIPNVKQFRADLEEFTKNEEYVALKHLEEKKEKEYDNIWQPNIFK
ncbi:hypothetical protein HOLleu_14061 [Holothuria leucospilota]|uniref:Uncharacterized protein n=1 Tax=Holothuria leucospilota TaxID=206669 RepID=A0A9Q1C865_HOLLE|nr:hypothetical protein HOLleu_14061 [Holothuria leucospilota]